MENHSPFFTRLDTHSDHVCSKCVSLPTRKLRIRVCQYLYRHRHIGTFFSISAYRLSANIFSADIADTWISAFWDISAKYRLEYCLAYGTKMVINKHFLTSFEKTMLKCWCRGKWQAWFHAFRSQLSKVHSNMCSPGSQRRENMPVTSP